MLRTAPWHPATSLRFSPAPRALAWALAAAALAASPAAARQNTTTRPERVDVSGQIIDHATRTPLAGAIVEVTDRRGHVVTDTNGRFLLEGIPTGQIRITVSLLGYAELSHDTMITADPAPIVLALEPQPLLLDGIVVQADRLRRRRNAVATSVRAFDRQQLLGSPAWSATEFVTTRAMVRPTDCPILSPATSCAFVRGRATPISVVIDEVPAIGGLDQLAMYRPDELFLIEVYAGGRHIRAYTTWFIERVAAGRTGLLPFLF